MKRLLPLLFLLLTACFPKHEDPVTFWDQTPAQASLAASLQARDIGGRAFLVMDTHSMEPLLFGGDWIVVDTKFPFAKLTKGQPIAYHPQWEVIIDGKILVDPIVTHRTQLLDSYGWLVEGDNVSWRFPEGHWRVTETEFVGKVIAIYTTRHK